MPQRRRDQTHMRTLKILHAADLHLDSAFEGLSSGKASIRRAEQRELLEKIAQLSRSEKRAMGYLLDGRASAVWGTHTHVQTSDACVLPKGTGYISDLGMTGPVHSVLGVDPEQSIGKFMGDPPRRYDSAKGPSKLEGCIFEIDPETGKCLSAEGIRLT